MIEPHCFVDYLTEQWVKITRVQKEGYYISDLGRIKIIKKSREIIKLGSLHKQGYYVLSYALRKPCIKVHQLVIESFTDRPDWAECVNHKNGIKTDNRLCNLEWSTYALNNLHAYQTGLRISIGKSHHNSIAEKTVHEVYQLKKDGMRICDIARRLKVDRTRIGAIYRGKDWKYEYKKFFS